MRLNHVFGVRAAVFALLGVGAAGLSQAHHSQTMFDLSKTITLAGTVTEVDWANPHTLFFIDAKEVGVSDAPTINYCLEGQSPNFLMKNGEGWKPNTLKVGDKITLHGNPRKDAKPTVLLLDFTAADGKHYTSKASFPSQ